MPLWNIDLYPYFKTKAESIQESAFDIISEGSLNLRLFRCEIAEEWNFPSLPLVCLHHANDPQYESCKDKDRNKETDDHAKYRRYMCHYPGKYMQTDI